MVKFIKFEKKFGWSEAFAFVAILISLFSLWQSCQSRKDTRMISGLNVRPILNLYATLPKNRNSTSYFTVSNVGPTDAVQIEIHMIFHTYSPNNKTATGSVSTTWNSWVIDELSPLKHKSFKLPTDELIERIELFENPENQVIELQLTYRRLPDKKKYMESSLYFVNPESRWVNEEDQSLTEELYGPIKRSIYGVLNREERPNRFLTDKLHPQEPTLP